jgi:hypothetical protein
VQPADPLQPSRHRAIDAGRRGRAALELEFTRFDSLFEVAFEGIRGSPDLFACLGVETGEGLQDFGEGTSLAAQELGFELLEASLVCVRDLPETFPQRF